MIEVCSAAVVQQGQQIFSTAAQLELRNKHQRKDEGQLLCHRGNTQKNSGVLGAAVFIISLMVTDTITCKLHPAVIESVE